MQRIKRAGIDFSMTSPAICIGYDDEVPTFHAFKGKKKQFSSHPNLILYDYPEWSSQEERFDKLAKWVLQIVADADAIQIEGYAMGGKGKVFDIAESTGIVKHYLFNAGKGYLAIPPTVAKKFATGKGNSGKNLMVLAYKDQPGNIDVFGVLGEVFDKDKKDVKSPMGDIIDSYWMWKYREEI